MATTFLATANRAYSTLAGDITNVDTSLSAATGEGTRFPTPTPTYVIVIGNPGTSGLYPEGCEHVLVGARSTDTFSSLTRSYDGTTAPPGGWPTGTPFRLVLVKKYIDDITTAINNIENGTTQIVLTAPGAIGSVTPNTGKFTTLEATGATFATPATFTFGAAATALSLGAATGTCTINNANVNLAGYAWNTGYTSTTDFTGHYDRRLVFTSAATWYEICTVTISTDYACVGLRIDFSSAQWSSAYGALEADIYLGHTTSTNYYSYISSRGPKGGHDIKVRDMGSGVYGIWMQHSATANARGSIRVQYRVSNTAGLISFANFGVAGTGGSADIAESGVFYFGAPTATTGGGAVSTVGGVHVGGTSDPGVDNLIVDGTSTLTGQVDIGGGYGSTGCRIETDGDILTDGAITASGFGSFGGVSVGVALGVIQFSTASSGQVSFQSVTSPWVTTIQSIGDTTVSLPISGSLVAAQASATPATTGTMTLAHGASCAYSLWTITPTGSCTFNATGGVAGQTVSIRVLTSGTSSYTLTFGTNYKSTGTLATGTVTAKTFMISFVYDGSNWCEKCRTVAM